MPVIWCVTAPMRRHSNGLYESIIQILWKFLLMDDVKIVTWFQEFYINAWCAVPFIFGQRDSLLLYLRWLLFTDIICLYANVKSYDGNIYLNFLLFCLLDNVYLLFITLTYSQTFSVTHIFSCFFLLQFCFTSSARGILLLFRSLIILSQFIFFYPIAMYSFTGSICHLQNIIFHMQTSDVYQYHLIDLFFLFLL